MEMTEGVGWKGAAGFDVRVLHHERWGIEARGDAGPNGAPLYGVRDAEDGGAVVASFLTRDQLIDWLAARGVPRQLVVAALS